MLILYSFILYVLVCVCMPNLLDVVIHVVCEHCTVDLV